MPRCPRRVVRVVRRRPPPPVDPCRGELRTGSRSVQFFLPVSAVTPDGNTLGFEIASKLDRRPQCWQLLHNRATTWGCATIVVGANRELASRPLLIPGIFGRKGACQPMLCCVSLGDKGSEIVLTGATSGHLYVWEGRNCTRCIKAHTGAIMTMTRCGRGDAWPLRYCEARTFCSRITRRHRSALLNRSIATQRTHSACPTIIELGASFVPTRQKYATRTVDTSYTLDP